MGNPLRSLRGRLTFFLLILLAPPLLIGVWTDYLEATGITNDVYDRALATTALALASRLERSDNDELIEVDLPPAADAVLRSDPRDHLYYVVSNSAGAVIAGDAELLALAQPDLANQLAYRDGSLHGTPVRVVAYRYRSPTLSADVMVAQTMRKRAEAASRILNTVVWTNLGLLVATIALVYFGVHYAIRPLERLSANVAQRAPNDLSPLPEDGLIETRPLVAALNRLLSNLQAASHAQQKFLSDAAHQLRTPLAALLTQLELASQIVPREHAARMRTLLLSTRRLGHFANQMLALARTAPEAVAAIEPKPVDLSALAQAVGADAVDSALAKGIDLGFETDSAIVHGSAWMLRELLANLLNNAINYCPPGSHVTVRTGEDDAGVFVEVVDDGPGIPESERARVLERFYRLPNTISEGSGLGLAIVKEVADRHAGTVEVTMAPDGKGTLVRIRLPSPKHVRARVENLVA
jgi:two-component system, OmpR family, sensor histidine kinase TctE